MGIDPATLKGLEPVELYMMIPHSFMNADPRVSLVGIVSLVSDAALAAGSRRIIGRRHQP